MPNRGTHYERAFEDFLQQRRIRYLALDQARKAVFAGVHLKSFDFVVYRPTRPSLLIDIKGRKTPWRSFQRHGFGQTWVTHEDVNDLTAWEQVFGPDHRAALVFAYWLFDVEAPQRTLALHRYAHRHYAFVAVDLKSYLHNMRPRSASWKTVYVPTASFAALAHPFGRFYRTV